MLTTSADMHPLLPQHHWIKDEKRMRVRLPGAQWAERLDAPVERSMAFVTPHPAERIIAPNALPSQKPKPHRTAPRAAPVQRDLEPLATLAPE